MMVTNLQQGNFQNIIPILNSLLDIILSQFYLSLSYDFIFVASSVFSFSDAIIDHPRGRFELHPHSNVV
jgi:hypothetical protein